MPPTLVLASSFTGSKLQIPCAVQENVAAVDISSVSLGRVVCQQKESDQVSTRHTASGKARNETELTKVSRRETILRSSSSALMLAFFNFACARTSSLLCGISSEHRKCSGERPDYLGVQSNPPSLALSPPTSSCISTSEKLNDPAHNIPLWTYNPQDGRGRKNPASEEKAMAELVDAINTTEPDSFTPRIVKQTDDYIYVEYLSPLVGLVDDVEFWFPPGNRSLVGYQSASRTNGIDFSLNRKRIKVLRQALERYG